MSTLNLTELLRQARASDRFAHQDKETAKLGVLRAGSTGAMADTGEIVGHCHRKSLLRMQGMEVEVPSQDKLIMFELGYANEEVVYNQLVSSLPEGHVVLREEEIPISWTTTNGTKVTGRPDIVICKVVEKVLSLIDSDTPIISQTNWGIVEYRGKAPRVTHEMVPVLGIELKSIHSMWTARDVLFSREPKLNNLLQAAHYMWKLNVPYRLHYKSYSQLGQGIAGGKGWVANLFPQQGEPGSELLEYNDKGNIKHIKQFEICYELEFGPTGRLQYREEGTDVWHSTIINRDDIGRYYEYVSKMAEDRQLGPRPLTLHANGEKMNYTDCQYCPLRTTCDTYETVGYSEWLEESTKVCRKSSDK